MTPSQGVPAAAGLAAAQGPRIVEGLPRRAQAYLLAVGAAATLAGALALAHGQPSSGDWLTFAILASSAAVAQFFLVGGGSYHGLHTAIAFVIAGALLLPPELVALMALVQHLPHGLRQRYPWYIQTFNVCNYTSAALAAWGTAHVVGDVVPGNGELRFALAGAAASIVWIFVNHMLLATMLRIARGRATARAVSSRRRQWRWTSSSRRWA